MKVINTLDELDIKAVFKTKTFKIEFDGKVLYFDVRRVDTCTFLIKVNVIVPKPFSNYHELFKTPSGEVIRNERKVIGIDIPIGIGSEHVEYDYESFGIDDKYRNILKEHLKKLFDLYNTLSEENDKIRDKVFGKV